MRLIFIFIIETFVLFNWGQPIKDLPKNSIWSQSAHELKNKIFKREFVEIQDIQSQIASLEETAKQLSEQQINEDSELFHQWENEVSRTYRNIFHCQAELDIRLERLFRKIERYDL